LLLSVLSVSLLHCLPVFPSDIWHCCIKLQGPSPITDHYRILCSVDRASPYNLTNNPTGCKILFKYKTPWSSV